MIAIDRNNLIRSKISSVSAINKINSARAPDKNNISLSKTCALNKIIRARHHDTSIKSVLNKINCARHHDISTKSALSTMRQPVPGQLLSNPRPQNKVLFNNNNSNSNNNKENNDKIDIGTILLPNTAKVMANLVYQSKTAAHLQQYHHRIMGVLSVKVVHSSNKGRMAIIISRLNSQSSKQASTKICTDSHGTPPYNPQRNFSYTR